MKKIKKYFPLVIIALALVLVFLTSRIINLTFLPIFTDESIYIRWAQIAQQDAAWRFISLTDGKQPLFIWIMMFAIKIFDDPLFAGRIISVCSGLMTMIGLFVLGRLMFKSSRIAVFTSILYLFLPFAFVYDRMALYDGMVGTFAVWSLVLEVILVQRLTLDVALILGMVIGGSILTKSSGFFNICLIPFSLILVFDWAKRVSTRQVLKFGLLSLIAIGEAIVIYSVLRLSPLFNMIATKNEVFVYSFSDWLTHPFTFFYGNLKGMFDWLVTYFGWHSIVFMLGSFLLIKKYWRQNILLFLWFLIPFVALAMFGKVLYPRFIFFMVLPLLPLIAQSFEFTYRKLKLPLFAIVICLFLAPWLKTDWQLSTNPYIANIPNSDKGQYFNGWPSGGGINESVRFFKQESEKEKIFVATEGTFGSPPYALEIYLIENKNIQIKGYWPLGDQLPDEVIEKAGLMPTYFVFNETQIIPEKWPLRLIGRYQKGIGQYYLSVYRVVPE